MSTNKQRLSTTHREIYRHDCIEFGYRVTYFYRLEEDGWYTSTAYCQPADNFSRAVGRSVARRKYFRGECHRCDSPVADETPLITVRRKPSITFDFKMDDCIGDC